MNNAGKLRYVVFLTAVAALGGLLFGYDTAIIAGAIAYLKETFGLSAFGEGLAVSIVLVGCMIGAAVAGTLCDRMGRRRFMLLSAVFFFISAVGCALPQNLVQFLAFRWIGGLAIGAASIVCPLYISEIAPPKIRGALVSVNQLAIVTGILVSYFVSWTLVGAGPANWRWMFATGAVPAVVFILFVLRIPESPRWLLKQGRDKEAQDVLGRVNEAAVAEVEMRAIRDALSQESGSIRELFRPGLRKVLFIGVFLAVFQQITGINAVIYYAPRFFETAGLGRSSAIFQSALIGLVNLVFTLVAIALVDKWGRKPMLLTGCAGMGLSFVLLGAAFKFQLFSGPLVLVLTLLYIAFFAMTQGPIIWVVISEIFPNRLRGRAMAIATAALWVADFAVSLSFPVIADKLHESFAFWLYAAMCAIDFVFIAAMLPETKGKSLEEIEKRWMKLRSI
ncbi:MAG: sugar porter family MFS transporter [Candidatus Aminicenantes bacterium]|nr:sugar porter family MFS transporter [Candidatus Aminicenantes bacterium]